MKILSFDIGIGLCGFALSIDQEIKLYGVLETYPDVPTPIRLVQLKMMINDLITKFQPNVIVAEKPTLTMGGKNVALVNWAYAALLIELGEQKSSNSLLNRFIEYTPGEVKKAVTGSGRADKKEVLDSVIVRVKIPPVAARFSFIGSDFKKEPIVKAIPDDAIDAVAINWAYMKNNNLQIVGIR